jgi:DNA-binding beta-propeller fold protein YncE
VDVATQGGDFRRSIDAAASPDGGTVYFTATGPNGAGVFRVPADGGRAEPVVTGAPFQSPVGLAVSTDGIRLFVADARAIFFLPATGGEARPFPGTEGMAPRGIEIVREGTRDVLYFTGRELVGGAPAVYKVSADGSSAPTTILVGAPLAAPEAVTATKDGVVYVSDRGSADGRGTVYRIRGGAADKVADLRAPELAGITLTLDESTLLASALSPKGTDEVLVLDLASLRPGTFSKTIGTNRHGGGLHRARNVNVFTWADLVAGPGRAGTVYVLRP